METLPLYKYQNDKFKNLETIFDTGYLIHSFDKKYENSEEFKNIKPVKINDNWFYYAF